MKKIAMKKTVATAAAAVMMLAGIPAVNASAASSTTGSSAYPYYNPATNLYYDTVANARAASPTYYDWNYNYYDGYYNGYHYYNGYYYDYPYYYNNYYYYNYYPGNKKTYSTSYPYYSSYTGRYYPTYSDALAASGGYSKYVTHMVDTVVYNNISYATSYSSAYPYYSTVTRRYYTNYGDAVYDSGNKSDCIYYYPSSTSYYSYYPSYYSYYPYTYSYRTVKKNTSSVPAADGVPYEYGNKKYWGWTNLSSYISRMKNGSTYAIEMNGASLVPTEILKVVRQKDITLQLVLDNGVIWEIPGKNIDSTDEVDLNVAYDTDGVPAELVNAAKKTGAVSVAQISIGKGSSKSLGLTGTVSVKFSSKRADCFVKIYLYDEDEGNLKLVDKTIINSKGRAEFSAKYSGNYLLVLS